MVACNKERRIKDLARAREQLGSQLIVWRVAGEACDGERLERERGLKLKLWEEIGRERGKGSDGGNGMGNMRSKGEDGWDH